MSKQLRRIVLTVSLLCGVAALADSLLKVSVEDQSSQPAAAVAVQIMRGTDVAASSDTDETGAAAFPRLAPGHYP